MKYTKPPLPFNEQIKLLQSRCLIIKDAKKALHILEHINYYRLSAYCLPFQSTKDIFDEGTTFEDILYLYEFDRRLRNLLIEGLGRIEISAKTQIAYYLAMNYGVFCYTRSSVFEFKPPLMYISHSEWIEKVRGSIKHSHEGFKTHFFSRYDEETDLPIWMAVELMSFGQVSQLYKGMKKHDRQNIARGYFKIDQRLMSSWLHTIVYIRNLCAHHGRVWNRRLAIRPLANKKDIDWNGVDNSRVYSIFMLIKKMMHFKDKWDEWNRKLLALLKEFHKIDIKKMGFPDNWKETIDL